MNKNKLLLLFIILMNTMNGIYFFSLKESIPLFLNNKYLFIKNKKEVLGWIFFLLSMTYSLYKEFYQQEFNKFKKKTNNQKKIYRAQFNKLIQQINNQKKIYQQKFNKFKKKNYNIKKIKL